MANPLDELIKIQLAPPSPTEVRSQAQPSQVQPPMLPQTQLPANSEQVPKEENMFQDPRFLIDLGARLLQPRSPAHGQLGFAAGALNEAMSAMAQRDAQAAKFGLAERGIEAKERQVDIAERQAEREIESQDVIDSLRGAQTEESKARAQRLLAEAANETATGGASGRATAEVQTINHLARNLQRLFPEKYSGESGQAQSQLDAFTIKERAGQDPDKWFADAVIDYYSNQGALATSEEQANFLDIAKTLQETVKQSTPSTQRLPDLPESGTPSSAREPVIQGGIFAGKTQTQALNTLRAWKQNQALMEQALMQQYPANPQKRNEVWHQLQQSMNRIQ